MSFRSKKNAGGTSTFLVGQSSNQSSLSSKDVQPQNHEHSKTPDYNAHLVTRQHHDKQENKAVRKENRAEQLRDDAQKIHEHNDTIGGIMNGTPLLVDHHSYNRHKKELDRMHTSEGKAYEMSHEADRLDKSADNARNPYAVSSNDPDAIIKLKNRIEDFVKEKADWKKGLKTADKNADYFSDKNPRMIRMHMSGLTTNIRNTKKKIDEINSNKKIKVEGTGGKKNGIEIKVDQEANRVRLHFDNIPPEEIRTKLKSRGWRWSPYNKAWQKHISNQAMFQAEEIQRI